MHETKKNYHFINTLLETLKTTESKNLIPINAVVTRNNEIHGYGQNRDIIDHAELLAIKQSFDKANQFSPQIETILYTSLEPCLMCVGAAINAQIKIIYYACRSFESGIHSKHNYLLIPDIYVIPLLKYEEKFKDILRLFFKEKRKKQFE